MADTRLRPRLLRALSRNIRRPLALAAGFVLVGAALQGLDWRIHDTPATSDHALVDVETTAVVLGDVSSGLVKVFSYTPGSTGDTQQAAREVLGGDALSQYNMLFSQVKQQAADESLTLTTRVSRAGVIRLSGQTAQVLVFLDQTIGRKDRPVPTYVGAQLSVTARLYGGHWRIVEIHAR